MMDAHSEEDDLIFSASSTTTSTGIGPIGSSSSTSTMMLKETSVDNNNNNNNNYNNNTSSNGICGFLSVSYYKPYFDVTTLQVKERILAPFMPWKNDFFGEGHLTKPELYGPFWIATTLVFLIAVTANVNGYLASDAEWEYDFKLLSIAASVIYGVLIVVPVIFWASGKYLSLVGTPALFLLITLYGYALMPYLPASLFCIIPNPIVQWVTVIIAFLFSAIFLSRNVFKSIQVQYEQLPSTGISVDSSGLNSSSQAPMTNSNSVTGMAVGILLLLHFGFSLTLKLLFFVGAEVNIENGGNSTSSSTTTTL